MTSNDLYQPPMTALSLFPGLGGQSAGSASGDTRRALTLRAGADQPDSVRTVPTRSASSRPALAPAWKSPAFAPKAPTGPTCTQRFPCLTLKRTSARSPADPPTVSVPQSGPLISGSPGQKTGAPHLERISA